MYCNMCFSSKTTIWNAFITVFHVFDFYPIISWQWGGGVWTRAASPPPPPFVLDAAAGGWCRDRFGLGDNFKRTLYLYTYTRTHTIYNTYSDTNLRLRESLVIIISPPPWVHTGRFTIRPRHRGFTTPTSWARGTRALWISYTLFTQQFPF